MDDAPLLVIAFGEGGHRAQARRLLRELATEDPASSYSLVSVVDAEGIGLTGSRSIQMSPLRQKHLAPLRNGLSFVRGLGRTIKGLFELWHLCSQSTRIVLVSLGPAFVIFPALLVRARGGTVIHIETWSRFKARSLTGRLMHGVSHHFWVQSPSLLPLYRKARFVGRL